MPGNAGDGQEWTKETLDISVGHPTELFGENAFYVNSINIDNTVSEFSPSSVVHSSTSEVSEVVSPGDIFVQYGNNVPMHNGYSQSERENGCGTSYSSPICASIVLLMKNIYKKIYGEQVSYGKGSDFMDFVKRHTGPIYNEMNRATGNGKPDLMLFNSSVANNTSVGVDAIEVDDVVAVCGKAACVKSKVTPANADNIALTYDYDLSKLAIAGDTVYPLKESGTEQKIGVTAYSNMNGDKNDNFEVVVPATNTKTYEVDKKYLTLDEAVTSNSQKFTLQLRVTFPDKDSDESYDFLTFTSGDTVLHLRGEFKEDSKLQRFRLAAFKDPDGKNYKAMQDNVFGGTRMENMENELCVITLAVDNDSYTFYLNGNLLRKGKLNADAPLSGLTVDTSFLPYGVEKDVRVYEEILSQEEIIQNTVALLNGNESVNIETALDAIIKLQNSLIGGDGE